MKHAINVIDKLIGTSEISKKLQRNPLTKYNTGLSFEIVCQNVGNIDIE